MTVDWRHLPSLAALRAFDATAQHGGFTGAGRALNVTHAAVAQQVRGLERELGVALVQRLGRAVSLTQQGQQLARTLDGGFAVIAEGIATMRRNEQQRGLRVATTIFMAQNLVMPHIRQFWALHPGIELSVTPSQSAVDLLRDGYDVAIRSFKTEGPGIEALHLARSRWLVTGAPSLLGDGEVDATRLPWIWVADSDHDRQLLQSVGIDVDQLHKVVVGNATLENTAAVLGLGLNLATEVVARDDIAAGRLREVEVPGLPAVDYYAIVASGPRRPAVDQFVSWVKGLF
ncbi:MAG: LysR substrate-binding domain-containing protein [bacterium]